ncbi:F-box protein At1g67340-like [Phragmites australis]|uniref:F-box protein At1g67340-like n=1 Tax=Phragmites australis TaxID=29695 RepID=UPI002D786656|nr:F-box protein At1g67340-like [Phragmites australis]
MRTRRGSLYSSGGEVAAVAGQKRKRQSLGQSAVAGECSGGGRRKRLAGGPDYLDELPDDLVLSILSKLAASASAPSDLLSVHLTCKRLNGLGRHDMVFAKASPASMAVKAAVWSEPAQRFLKCCADAGNLEACYILGMIRFYCLGSRSGGAALLARAAVGGHAAALYSLAVIQFNGSGGAKSDRDLRAGAALCARSAALGHVDALRELGHCLQDGYGVRRDPAEGRRLLVAANARELTLALAEATSHRTFTALPLGAGAGCPLLSEYGWSLPEAEPHAANQFMVDWWATHGGHAAGKRLAAAEATGDSEGDAAELRLCSHLRCGRRETRRHEFRRCSVCGAANYCSRACQALDWKRAHKAQCVPMDRWLLAGGEAAQ